MQIGIVGLPNSTKTTIFNALTHSQAVTSAVSTGQVETNTAVVSVPDPRVDRLSAMFKPKLTTPARVQYNDIAGLRAGFGTESRASSSSVAGPLLNALAINDALLHVVRAFEDDQVPHPDGTVLPARDVETLDFEFLVSDLGIVERRMERLQHDLDRKSNYPNRKVDQQEVELLARLKEALEREVPIRDVELTAEEEKLLRGYRFLTAKPVLVVLNIGDDGIDDPAHYLSYDHRRSQVICLRGGLEMEIAQLAEDEAAEFMREYGIAEPGLHRMIRLSYELLGLQSFFTVGEDEVRAWTVERGASAVEAAAAIHTDLARGFIRAEVVAYDDLLAAGSLAAARKAGKLRLEGRDYIVQDGDALNILFNI